MKSYLKDVKKRIENDEYDNVFTSDQIIDDSSFVDCLFIGKYNDQEVVWNVCFTTTKGDYFEHIDSKSLDEAFNKFPDNNYNLLDRFVPSPDNPEYYVYVDPHPELTRKRYRYQAELTIEELNKMEYKLAPWSITIDESYRYGIGLLVRLNIDSITVQDIFNFIKEFNIHGLDTFKQNKYDNELVSYNAYDLGVTLDDDSMFCIHRLNRSVGLKNFN